MNQITQAQYDKYTAQDNAKIYATEIRKFQQISGLTKSSAKKLTDEFLSWKVDKQQRSLRRAKDDVIIAKAAKRAVEKSATKPITKWVSVEDLFTAFQEFNSTAAKIMHLHARKPDQWELRMAAARMKFQRFCEQRNLPIDFTQPD
jgi:hypothetical protein